MLFPVELEDETLYSLLARLAIINGISIENLNFSTKKGLYKRAADIEIDFHLLASSTNEVYGNSAFLEKRYIRKPGVRDNTDQSLIGLSNFNKNIWRWCKDCFKEEQKKIGVAYWHIQHQQPCSVVCLKHHSALMEINLPFRERQSRFLLPKDILQREFHPACGKSSLNSALVIAQIQNRLLEDQAQLDPTILEVLVSSVPLNERPEGRLHHAILSIANGQKSQIDHLRKSLRSKTLDWAYLPLIIYAKFEDYDFFANAYQWQYCMNRGTTIEFDEVYVDMQTSHRNTCRDFLLQHPHANKTELWKRYPHSMRWLNRYDKKWLDNTLPPENRGLSSNQRLQMKLFK